MTPRFVCPHCGGKMNVVDDGKIPGTAHAECTVCCATGPLVEYKTVKALHVVREGGVAQRAMCRLDFAHLNTAST
jgi:hypothetical protein